MKKFLLVLMSVLMISSTALLGACGKDESNKQSDATSNQESTSNSASEGEKPSNVVLSVDASFSGNAGDAVEGKATYKTLTEALNAITAMNLSENAAKTIEIAAGEYKEKIIIPATMKNLTLIGSATGVSKITFDDYAGKIVNSVKLGTDRTASVEIRSDNFTAKNIYFENAFDYFDTSIKTDQQALAVYLRADKAVFYNCTFTGYQDTLEAVAGRHYFKNCTIKGAVDFIFGNNATSLFDNCDIVCLNRGKSGGYITATKGNNGSNGQEVPTYGYVFKGCRLTCEAGVADASISLGRPWRADSVVAWINCEMGAHIAKLAYGKGGTPRYTDMDGGGMINRPFNAHFAEYGNTGAGSTTEALTGGSYVDRVNGETVMVVSNKLDCTQLTKEQADLYTNANIFAATNGGVTYADAWDADAALTALVG